MADERKVYRSPARAQRVASGRAGPAAGWGRCAALYTQTAAQKNKQKAPEPGCFGPCAACLVLVIVLAVALTRCSVGPTGPAKADFGTPAAAWQKNELGYYLMRAARLCLPPC